MLCPFFFVSQGLDQTCSLQLTQLSLLSFTALCPCFPCEFPPQKIVRRRPLSYKLACEALRAPKFFLPKQNLPKHWCCHFLPFHTQLFPQDVISITPRFILTRKIIPLPVALDPELNSPTQRLTQMLPPTLRRLSFELPPAQQATED